MALYLRPMRLTDLAKMTALGLQCHIEWPPVHLEALARRPHAFCRVAELGDEIVGALTAQIWPHEAELFDVAIAPAHRRKQIAKSLIAELLTAAAAQRVPRVLCEVASDNQPAQALYRSFGFAEISLRPGYYKAIATEAQSAHHVDAQLLERRL